MQTVITHEIDGVEIVTGFGRLAIEPVETKPKVAAALKETAEFAATRSLQEELGAMRVAAATAYREGRASKDAGARARIYRQYESFTDKAGEIEKRLIPSLKTLEAKRRELVIEHAVYFQPPSHEKIMEPEKIAKLRALMAEPGSGFVTVDGTVINDLRGSRFCKSDGVGGWYVTTIRLLSDQPPSDFKLYDDLTEADRLAVDYEVQRGKIAAMPLAERAVARVAAEEKAMDDAELFRRKLEIQDDSKALAKSQRQYKAAIANIETLYTAVEDGSSSTANSG